MGDGGSYFLGSLLACSTIKLNSEIINSQYFVDNPLILFTPLLVFLFQF